ncbi:uncharacterized protein BO72DRAFT_492668 [Aspergillus fijiensis CBS 313.89]|uniref:Uncharacterized protein n=1 Tax=Aspergillus fijiensis CBS 313.89 TaxID=1448319 RepID=A0A8G1RWB3_9EURO|nr:uncharacterized protein BO72DRAFT_492668 [Aspergillus fijiensis CBS 313.89]RAK81247.1 hypothetical protein BO72DRAFT_492668 [Aspergillus fijiensis CBS 313.89]
MLHWLGAKSGAGQHDDDERDTCDVQTHDMPVIPSSRIFQILFDNCGDDQDLISISARGGSSSHRDIESFLWKVLDPSVGKNREHFLNLAEENQDRILELTARYKAPGNEGYLDRYFEYLLPGSTALNVLQTVVSLKKPVVVWWLLSNGEYPSEDDIQHAEKQAESWGEHDRNGRLILDLLTDPPPIQQTSPPADDHHCPSFDRPASDFGRQEGSPVIDIIYRKGPGTIMHDFKYREVSALTDALENGPLAEPKPERSKPGHRKETKMAVKHGFKITRRTPSELDLRCLTELLVRLSKDRGLTNKDHRALAAFIDNNQALMHASGHKTYMKPQL